MRDDEDRLSRSVGLCATCDNSSTCWHRSRRGFDAQHCELFDNSGGSDGPVAVGGSKTMISTNRVSEDLSNEVPVLKGLCINCEIRETCMLPRPIEGVWHCEEYQ